MIHVQQRNSIQILDLTIVSNHNNRKVKPLVQDHKLRLICANNVAAYVVFLCRQPVQSMSKAGPQVNRDKKVVLILWVIQNHQIQDAI